MRRPQLAINTSFCMVPLEAVKAADLLLSLPHKDLGRSRYVRRLGISPAVNCRMMAASTLVVLPSPLTSADS